MISSGCLSHTPLISQANSQALVEVSFRDSITSKKKPQLSRDGAFKVCVYCLYYRVHSHLFPLPIGAYISLLFSAQYYYTR